MFIELTPLVPHQSGKAGQTVPDPDNRVMVNLETVSFKRHGPTGCTIILWPNGDETRCVQLYGDTMTRIRKSVPVLESLG